MKGGRTCVNCLPSRKGRCGNESSVGAAPEPSAHPALPVDSPSTPDVASSSRCVCGQADDGTGRMIRCGGPCGEWYHRECTGESDTCATREMWCLQCSIQRLRHAKILRHIPKGARIQTAAALAEILEQCARESLDITPWRKYFLFAATVLAVPHPSHHQGQKKTSLTTAVRHQLAAYVTGAFQLPPLTEDLIIGTVGGVSGGQRMRRRVETKLADGDVSGAVRILSSDSSLAPLDTESLNALHSKHPPAPHDLNLPPAPDSTVEPLTVTPEIIEKTIRSFNPGSAAGPDKLRPQHLKELISRQTGAAGTRLLSALTSITNMLLAGRVPEIVKPLLYGANLIALCKPDGGIRPIAVGNTLRRMVAKSISFLLRVQFGDHFRPRQLGCGTPGGCEAAVHATRRFLENSTDTNPRIVLKIDYKNAFNSIRRDTLLSIIQNHYPEIYPFIWQCYSTPSALLFGDHIIQSSSGVQQGDPLGPALFSLSLQPLVDSLSSELNIWYLDDGTIGGSVEDVINDLKTIIHQSPHLGLELNASKCEVILGEMDLSSANVALAMLREVAPDVHLLQRDTATLLGAPLFHSALSSSLRSKIHVLERLTSRLECLHAHDALFLLKNCLAIPKLMYLLRSSPAWQASEDLEAFDAVLYQSIQSICNINLDSATWLQATLPTSKGGLGIRRASDVALPAFLASCHSTQELVNAVLPEGEPDTESLLQDAMDCWEEKVDQSPPCTEYRKKQSSWDDPLVEQTFNSLLAATVDPSSKARLLATATKESGAWLNVLPAAHLGTKLDDDSIRIATGLRLGANIVEEHTCVCGSTVKKLGHHGLSCRRSGGRISRHHTANETIRRALVSGGVPAVLEPVGVCREDGKRPDGMT